MHRYGAGGWTVGGQAGRQGHGSMIMPLQNLGKSDTLEGGWKGGPTLTPWVGTMRAEGVLSCDVPAAETAATHSTAAIMECVAELAAQKKKMGRWARSTHRTHKA